MLQEFTNDNDKGNFKADFQLSPALTAFGRYGARNADIWIVAADGTSAAKLLVGGEKTENTPRWTPDAR